METREEVERLRWGGGLSGPTRFASLGSGVLEIRCLQFEYVFKFNLATSRPAVCLATSRRAA